MNLPITAVDHGQSAPEVMRRMLLLEALGFTYVTEIRHAYKQIIKLADGDQIGVILTDCFVAGATDEEFEEAIKDAQEEWSRRNATLQSYFDPTDPTGGAAPGV